MLGGAGGTFFTGDFTALRTTFFFATTGAFFFATSTFFFAFATIAPSSRVERRPFGAELVHGGLDVLRDPLLVWPLHRELHGVAVVSHAPARIDERSKHVECK